MWKKNIFLLCSVKCVENHMSWIMLCIFTAFWKSKHVEKLCERIFVFMGKIEGKLVKILEKFQVSF